MRTVLSVLVSVFLVAGCGGAAGSTAPVVAVPASAAPVSPAAASSPVSVSPAAFPAGDQTLPAGTYILDPKLAITIDVPAGWASCCGSAITKDDFSALLFSDVTGLPVYADACDWKDGGQTKPKGAKAFAAALAAQRDREASKPRDVNIGGLPGVHVRLTVPTDQGVAGDFSRCDNAEFRSFEGRHHQGASQIDDYYFVDVGDRTINFDLVSGPDIPPTDMAELEAMLASIKID